VVYARNLVFSLRGVGVRWVYGETIENVSLIRVALIKEREGKKPEKEKGRISL